MPAQRLGLTPFRLSVCGVAELGGFADQQVGHVIGILDPGTPRPLAYGTLGHGSADEFRFWDIVVDEGARRPPGEMEARHLLAAAERLHARPAGRMPGHVLVHCFAGISRSTATAVLLMALNNPGREAEIFQALGEIRPKAWPNSSLIGQLDRLLGRGGALVEAMKAHHIAVASRHPDMVDLMIEVGRGHEVPAPRQPG